jgi:hypothetical protein
MIPECCNYDEKTSNALKSNYRNREFDFTSRNCGSALILVERGKVGALGHQQ